MHLVQCLQFYFILYTGKYCHSKFKTEQIPLSPIIFLKKQLCLGDFKTGNIVFKCRRANMRWGKKIPCKQYLGLNLEFSTQWQMYWENEFYTWYLTNTVSYNMYFDWIKQVTLNFITLNQWTMQSNMLWPLMQIFRK